MRTDILSIALNDICGKKEKGNDAASFLRQPSKLYNKRIDTGSFFVIF